jgi:hypothetical protein
MNGSQLLGATTAKPKKESINPIVSGSLLQFIIFQRAMC